MGSVYMFDFDDFIYNANTKKYTIAFNHSRLQKIRKIVFENFYYTNSSNTSHVVMVHSNLCKHLSNHRVFKGSHHVSKTNTLFTLQETHSKNRYELKNKRIFNLDRSIYGFDLYFTDHKGQMISQASSNVVVNNDNVTVENITDELGNDCTAFIDYHPSRTLSNTFQEVSEINDDVTYLHSLVNTECILSVQYGTSQKLVAFNSSGTIKGITSITSWQSVFDNLLAVYNTSFIPDPDCCISFCFKLTGNTGVYLVEHQMFKIFYSGGLKFKDVQGNDQVVPNVSIIPLQPYFMVVERLPQTSEFQWTVTKLTDGTQQTALTDCGGDWTALQTNLRFGRANFNFTHVMSYFWMYNNVTEARKTMIHNFVTQMFDSNVVVENEPTTHVENIFFEMRTIA
ncbi:MAG: hypothetical protein CMJ75_13295 [Planctomycetaceae bacterium]|nr:hypothetical protein [Planctomycetaceae bacterium]